MNENDFSELKSLLECPICLELFTNPITTSCGHNFCKNCLEKSLSQSCAICRSYISYISLNLGVSKLVDFINNLNPYSICRIKSSIINEEQFTIESLKKQKKFKNLALLVNLYEEQKLFKKSNKRSTKYFEDEFYADNNTLFMVPTNITNENEMDIEIQVNFK